MPTWAHRPKSVPVRSLFLLCALLAQFLSPAFAISFAENPLQAQHPNRLIPRFPIGGKLVFCGEHQRTGSGESFVPESQQVALAESSPRGERGVYLSGNPDTLPTVASAHPNFRRNEPQGAFLVNCVCTLCFVLCSALVGWTCRYCKYRHRAASARIALPRGLSILTLARELPRCFVE